MSKSKRIFLFVVLALLIGVLVPWYSVGMFFMGLGIGAVAAVLLIQ